MGTVLYTDQRIAQLVAEPKPVQNRIADQLKEVDREGYRRAELEIVGESGNRFVLKTRRSLRNPLSFSVIVTVRIPGSNKLFRLRRYNGRHGFHRNHIEKERFFDFHIHQATERYQQRGWDEDKYAVPTTLFSDFDGALRLAVDECNIIEPDSPPLSGDNQIPIPFE